MVCLGQVVNSSRSRIRGKCSTSQGCILPPRSSEQWHVGSDIVPQGRIQVPPAFPSIEVCIRHGWSPFSYLLFTLMGPL